jgi:hypothetical protein
LGPEIEAGTLGGRLGYLRFGGGPRTLVPFFPEPVLRATAGTRMQLRLLPGGHGVPKRHAGRLQAELSAFFTA